uniref:C2H2-type domain-containing protein n=1 Tax=Lutzomyia longipalpis TaxID=7200 RepID=A0A1B0CDW8_LUTLO
MLSFLHHHQSLLAEEALRYRGLFINPKDSASPRFNPFAEMFSKEQELLLKRANFFKNTFRYPIHTPTDIFASTSASCVPKDTAASSSKDDRRTTTTTFQGQSSKEGQSSSQRFPAAEKIVEKYDLTKPPTPTESLPGSSKDILDEILHKRSGNYLKESFRFNPLSDGRRAVSPKDKSSSSTSSSPIIKAIPETLLLQDGTTIEEETKCTVCMATFPSVWLLEQHAALQHAGMGAMEEKPFICEQCGQSYRYRSAYVKHREQNHRARLPADKLFTCDVCGMQFRYLKSFKKHRLNHALERLHGKNEKKYGMELGTEVVTSSNDDENELKITIKEEEDEEDQDDTVDSAGGNLCSTAEQLGDGDIVVPKITSSAETMEYTSTNSGSVINEREDQLMKKRLEVCSLPATSVNSLLTAERIPSDQALGLNPQEASILNFLRVDAAERQRDRRFACPFCGKCVRSKENLKLHVRKHTGERPFVCLFCGRAFGGKSDLTRHLRIHTGERPYHCEACGKYRGLFINPKDSASPRFNPFAEMFSKEQELLLKRANFFKNTFRYPIHTPTDIFASTSASCVPKDTAASSSKDDRRTTTTTFQGQSSKEGQSSSQRFPAAEKIVEKYDLTKPPTPTESLPGSSKDILDEILHKRSGNYLKESFRFNPLSDGRRAVSPKDKSSSSTSSSPIIKAIPETLLLQDGTTIEEETKCTVCMATFPSVWLLEQHAALQHAGMGAMEEKPFICEQCGQSYRYRSAYVKHREQNHRARLPADKLFTCDVCGMQFRYLKSFKKHRLNHALERLHGKNEKKYGMELGTEVVTSSNDDENELKITIKEEEDEEDQDDTVDSAGGNLCSTAEQLGDGDIVVPKITSSAETMEYTSTNSGSVINEREDQLMKKRLEVCSLPATSVNSLLTAERIPSDQALGLNPQEASILNFLRVDAAERQRDRRFACPFCGKCVRSKENLKLHVRKHTGERPFVCLFCGRAFGGKSDLTRHLRIHTGERPYHCEACGKCFARADYLPSTSLRTYIIRLAEMRLSDAEFSVLAGNIVTMELNSGGHRSHNFSTCNNPQAAFLSHTNNHDKPKRKKDEIPLT